MQINLIVAYNILRCSAIDIDYDLVNIKAAQQKQRLINS